MTQQVEADYTTSKDEVIKTVALLGGFGATFFAPTIVATLMSNTTSPTVRLAEAFATAAAFYLTMAGSGRKKLSFNFKDQVVPKLVVSAFVGGLVGGMGFGVDIKEVRKTKELREQSAAAEVKRISTLPLIDAKTVIMTKETSVAEYYCYKGNSGKEVLVTFKGQEFKAICP